MAVLEIEPAARKKSEKFRVLTLKTPFVHKTVPLYVETCAFPRVLPEGSSHEAVTEPTPPPAIPADAGPTAFLAHVTPRQVRVAVDYLDGLTQAEIAERCEIDQATVSRDLRAVRRAAARFGGSLPKPRQIIAACEVQMSERLYKSL